MNYLDILKAGYTFIGSEGVRNLLERIDDDNYEVVPVHTNVAELRKQGRVVEYINNMYEERGWESCICKEEEKPHPTGYIHRMLKVGVERPQKVVIE